MVIAKEAIQSRTGREEPTMKTFNSIIGIEKDHTRTRERCGAY